MALAETLNVLRLSARVIQALHPSQRGYLTAHNLTPDELRKCLLPDFSLISAGAKIKYEDALPAAFQVHYYPSSFDKGHVWVAPYYEPGKSEGMDLKRLSKAEIADIGEFLLQISIPKTYPDDMQNELAQPKVESILVFGPLPESAIKVSGLPLEKLTFSSEYNEATRF